MNGEDPTSESNRLEFGSLLPPALRPEGQVSTFPGLSISHRSAGISIFPTCTEGNTAI